MKTILFQGDSITDANRNRMNPKGLGDGYVKLVNDQLGKDFVIFNRGISGHRTIDLVKRWNQDTIALKPDILFILIGINDIWHHYKFGIHSTKEEYEKNAETMITMTQQALPNCRIVFLDPFVLKIGHYEPRWEARLMEQHEILKRLTRKYHLDTIHIHQLLNQATEKHPVEAIAPDGVHLGDLGNTLVAQAVADYLKRL